MRRFDLDGRKVLVVGGSGVIGGEIARELMERGATVVIAGRNPGRLHQRATELGSQTQSITFDITVDAHVEHVVSTAVAMMGGLDGLVNAVGIVAFGPLSDMSGPAVDLMASTNLVAPLKLIREVIPHLKNGFVVNISGVVAESPVAGMTTYSAMKSGLSAATRALGRELRREGIQVLDARPPHTETGLADRPIVGVAPPMPTGLNPAHVAKTIVEGIAAGKRELPADVFSQP